MAATVYAPCTVATTVAGVDIALTETTDYPFRDSVTIQVDPARPVRFPVQLRVPGWASAASIRINGEAHPDVVAGRFARIEREWRRGDRIELVEPFALAAEVAVG